MKTLAIIGLGMMGGSIGLAVKQRKLPYRIVGIGRNPARLKSALKLKICDEISTDPSAGVRDAEIAVICTTVGQIVPFFEKMRGSLKAGAVATDIGSVKSPVVESVKHPSFVGGHPLCGSEKTGFENSRADLYEGATVVLCPSEGTRNSAVEQLKDFWTSLGGKPLVMDARIHDLLVAQTSHLPHVLAGAFVQLVSGLSRRDENAGELLAGSFRDMTRIVDSDPRQWAEIAAANQKYLIGAVKSFRDILLRVIKDMESGSDPVQRWEDFFSAARSARQKLLNSPHK